MSMLTTDQKGAVAEAAITLAALKSGVGVFRPLADEPYDLIFDLGTRLLRVQCKWAVRRGMSSLLRVVGTVEAQMGSFGGSTNRGKSTSSPRIAPIRIKPSSFRLRCPCRGPRSSSATARLGTIRPAVSPGLGFRPRGYNTALPGPIAQLGERVHGMHEVAGSSPAGSIVVRAPSHALRACHVGSGLHSAPRLE